MTAEQQPQDHPGPEWVALRPGVPFQVWLHPTLGFLVSHLDPTGCSELRYAVGGIEKAQALPISGPKACRAISAAALAWERMKEEAKAEANIPTRTNLE